MGRRIEVELTSSRDDGSWTWRAAGAKKPKGDVAGTLLYDGAQVGDVVKVEAEFHLDGIEITEVFVPKAKKERSNLLEMKTRELRDDELVTTQRVARSDRRGDREDGRGRGDDRGAKRGGGGGGGGRGGGGGESRGPRPEADRRPRPKRLRPRRVHRDAMLAGVTEEHRPIVEQVIKDGMPGVRAAIEKQNAEAKEAGKPEIDASPILSIAEKNLSQARLAEWRDRADAALADAEELDIRDLRSVVVAGADVARDDETRALADQIKSVLDTRLESDHAAWLKDLDNAVTEGRVVRGLRLSSRPVKAGAPLPTEIASKLAQQASDALAADVMQDRWATVLDALAFSPVRGAVTPAGVPAEPKEELLTEVRRLSDRIPTIAALFGIDPSEVPKSAKRRRPPRKDQGKDQKGGGGRGDNSGGRRDGGGGRGDNNRGDSNRGDSRGGKPARGRPGDDRKGPKDPSATKPNARPVPGAEKPEEEAPPQEDTSEDAPSAEAENVEVEAPETAAAQTDTGADAETSAPADEPTVEPTAAAEAPEQAPEAEAAPAEDAPEADTAPEAPEATEAAEPEGEAAEPEEATTAAE